MPLEHLLVAHARNAPLLPSVVRDYTTSTLETIFVPLFPTESVPQPALPNLLAPLQLPCLETAKFFRLDKVNIATRSQSTCLQNTKNGILCLRLGSLGQRRMSNIFMSRWQPGYFEHIVVRLETNSPRGHATHTVLWRAT